MTQRVLAAALPAALQPVLLRALSLHPGLPRHPNCDPAAWAAGLDALTRGLVGDGPAWQDGGGSVEGLVGQTLREALPPEGLWGLSEPAVARETVAALEAHLVVWVGDARHALRGAAAAPDPIEAAVFRGWSWRDAFARLQGTPGLVLLDPRRPGRLFESLGLSAHPRTASALAVLARLPAPGVPRAVEAAFRVWPEVEAVLPTACPSAPSLPRHPAVLAARSCVAAHRGETRLARDLAVAAWSARPAATVRTELLRVLARTGDAGALVERAAAWRVDADAPDAWVALLALADHPASHRVAGKARVHRSPRVRSAAGRWLVHHGLDREAAEEVCALRGVDWTAQPQTCAGGRRLW